MCWALSVTKKNLRIVGFFASLRSLTYHSKKRTNTINTLFSTLKKNSSDSAGMDTMCFFFCVILVRALNFTSKSTKIVFGHRNYGQLLH